MRITFIGNEGVVVDAGSSAIAIDAMFGDGAGPYADTPPALRDALEAARGRWRDIELILATHGHPDHFEARAVVRHMRSNPDARLVTTRQAASMLEAEPGADAVIDRVRTVVAPEGRRVQVRHEEILVEAFGLSHGKVNYADVEHLGLLVRFGGLTLLHLGDGIIDQRALRQAGIFDERIDAAFLPFWYFTYPFGRRLLETALRPAHAFAVHVPPEDASRLQIDVAAARDDAVVLVRPGAEYRVDAGRAHR